MGLNRMNKGKPEWHLVDFSALNTLVEVLEFGKNKYEEHG